MNQLNPFSLAVAAKWLLLRSCNAEGIFSWEFLCLDSNPSSARNLTAWLWLNHFTCLEFNFLKEYFGCKKQQQQQQKTEQQQFYQIKVILSCNKVSDRQHPQLLFQRLNSVRASNSAVLLASPYCLNTQATAPGIRSAFRAGRRRLGKQLSASISFISKRKSHLRSSQQTLSLIWQNHINTPAAREAEKLCA